MDFNPCNRMVLIMSEKNGAHAFVSWTKQRLDEMDATLASLETKAGQAKTDVTTKADHLVAELKQRRDDFEAKAKARVGAEEAALQAKKAQLEFQWSGFEGQIRTYFDTVGKEVAHKQATFREAATAQAKAWRETADKLHDAAAQLASDKRAGVVAAAAQLRTDAAAAEARLQKLKQAGEESWTVLGAALAQSRKAFDEANQKAWDALRRAASPKH